MDEQQSLRIGSMISEFSNPSMPRIFDAAGFDFAILDGEHGAFDFETVAAMANVAVGTRLDLFVRVPQLTRDYLGTYLDAGVAGIVAPMVETPEQAALLVDATRYPPLGKRGISVTRAHSGFHVDDLQAYLAAANARVEVFAQIETRASLEAVDEIVATPGLTGLFVGPNDLLGDIGTPGDNSNPELHEAIRRVMSAAAAHGKIGGIITGNAELLTIAREAGASILSVNSDVGYLLRAATAELAKVRRL